MTPKKIVKTFLPPEHIASLIAIAEASQMSVSGLIAQIIAERLAASEVEQFAERAESLLPTEYDVKNTVRYDVVLPLSIMDVIDARAKNQGLSRKRYVASLLTSHASLEPIYDRAAQATIVKTLDKVHAMAVSLNMLRVSVESRGAIPKILEAELLTVREICQELIIEINQMRLANVERWRST